MVNRKKLYMKKTNSKSRGFTLIELLVVIAVIGILMGMVGPKVFNLLSSSKVKKSQAIYRSWVTQLYQYKEFYKYFPPFLLEENEGIPTILSEDMNHDSFIAALKGMKWLPETSVWEPLDDELRDQNKKGREFHSFSEDEFNSKNYLADAWEGQNIRIVVDLDGDGLIKLDSSAVDEIVTALKQDYDPADVDNAKEKLSVIREKVGVYSLFNSKGDDEFENEESENVFSWDIAKYIVEE